MGVNRSWNTKHRGYTCCHTLLHFTAPSSSPCHFLTVTAPPSGTTEPTPSVNAMNLTNFKNVHQMWLTFHWLPIHPLPDMLLIRRTN